MTDIFIKILEWFLTKLPILAAGFVGSIVHMIVLPPKTFAAASAIVFSGMACAYYIAPGMADYMQIESQNIRGLLAFGGGSLGMLIVTAFVKGGAWVYHHPIQTIAAIKSYLPKRGGGNVK